MSSYSRMTRSSAVGAAMLAAAAGLGAAAVCGGVMTANATVYLIDSVLLPPSM